MFEFADRCCREHDHCTNVIPAFTVNYGVFNPNFYTVSHCDCDQRFRQCLVGVNDTISNMVGYSFFNILRAPCFKLRPRTHCTELYWWGWCKVSKEAPYAVFEKALAYNSTSDSNMQESKGSEEQTPKQKPKNKHPKYRDHNSNSSDKDDDDDVTHRKDLAKPSESN
ncbi:phospholipase A2 isozymes PA3A/PA3B/PA5-like [Aplochiton taeniatus]